MLVTVLGVGNLLRRDDGVGIHVIEELRRRFHFPEGVRLVDGGLGGPGLLGAVEGSDVLIAVDAVRGGQPPGTLYRIPAADLRPVLQRSGVLSVHEAGLVDLVAAAAEALPGMRVTILGVEPAETGEWGMELTGPVAARLPALVGLVLAELRTLGVTWEDVFFYAGQ